jgi:hypothetical protein
MPDKKPTPLQASYWLTKQEKHYVLILCALALLGIAARFFYLKYEKPKVYTPAGIGKTGGQQNQTGSFAQSRPEDE